jgi:hypothetical protein
VGKGGDLCCTYRGFFWERWGWPLIYEEAGAGCFTVDSLLYIYMWKMIKRIQVGWFGFYLITKPKFYKIYKKN